MNKYTRKQINIKTQLHDKEFITIEDATAALVQLASIAVGCGADEDKLMEFFKDE